MKIENTITHYFESDYGPFLNICNLPTKKIADVVRAERGISRVFNRYDFGLDFFKWRCNADNLLRQLYKDKFKKTRIGRPYYATLGTFDRTAGMYRKPGRIIIDMSFFKNDDDVTFIYEDHSHLNWLIDKYPAPPGFKRKEYHGKLFTYSELNDAIRAYQIDRNLKHARKNGYWVGAYIEAHIWNPNIKKHLESLRQNWNDCVISKSNITLSRSEQIRGHGKIVKKIAFSLNK